jgi:hypothetical protein
MQQNGHFSLKTTISWRLPTAQRSAPSMTLAHDESFGIPIVAVEETMRGWLAAIAKERLAQRQVTAYRKSQAPLMRTPP